MNIGFDRLLFNIFKYICNVIYAFYLLSICNLCNIYINQQQFIIVQNHNYIRLSIRDDFNHG